MNREIAKFHLAEIEEIIKKGYSPVLQDVNKFSNPIFLGEEELSVLKSLYIKTLQEGQL